MTGKRVTGRQKSDGPNMQAVAQHIWLSELRAVRRYRSLYSELLTNAAFSGIIYG